MPPERTLCYGERAAQDAGEIDYLRERCRRLESALHGSLVAHVLGTLTRGRVDRLIEEFDLEHGL